MNATCPGPCTRCGKVRTLRRDDLCGHCGAGVDLARIRDGEEDERLKSMRAFETFLGLPEVLEAAS